MTRYVYSAEQLTWVAALLLFGVPNVADAANILAFFPAPSHSHMTLKSTLLRELTVRGHQLNVVSTAPEKTPLANYTDIVVSLPSFAKIVGGNPYNLEDNTLFETAIQTWHLGCGLCADVLSDTKVQELIHSKDLHFDLIIMEAFFSDCFLQFAYKFKAPVVKFCTFGGTHWMGDWVGNPSPPSYVPDAMLNLGDRMSFWERAFNLLGGTFFRLGRQLYYLPRLDAVVRNLFNVSEPLPRLVELEATTTTLVLLNSHFSISYPRPLTPSIVEVGGLHVRPPRQLPQDLQKYLDEASHGVVYFSMGSILKSSDLPDVKRQALLKAFAKIKQKVLWKWETESLPGQPDNVRLGQWLPQSDILAHPNVLLFVTHGGLLSSQEAITRGIPIVGIPIFGDQKHNVARAVSFGIGIRLDFNNISEHSVSWALREGLENPKYLKNARRLSRLFQDQPLTPLQQAVYWTEYVMRHKGAPHMRSAALDLTWYQYMLLDVIAVLCLVISSVLFVTFLLLKTMINQISKFRTTKHLSKKNK
ncbi:UDP-glycosyltransferase UGT5-like isoform X1 [Periplaneta americana]|uniref:UDP-glycosyltransferase UGT5-like isoform X1 n=1 Tax=Periplaneta americana TaxID=6978 RepID=UPI0037E79F70